MSQQDLFALQSTATFQQANAHIFDTHPGLLWFIRKHRKKLDAAGALVTVNRRVLIVPSSFSQVVLTVGRAEQAENHEHESA